MTTDLKPCPLCGNPPKYDGVSRYSLIPLAWCDTVGCPLDGDALTISQWNTRAPVRVKLPSKRKPGDNEEDYGYNCAIDDVVHALKAQGVEVE